MREGIGFLAFTDRGEALAGELAGVVGGEIARAGRDVNLGTWTDTAFREKTALVYVGAVGIAVRAVAPYLKHKAEDPAVLAVEETGHYVIPLLSGHLGGANALARELAAITGGEAVITTATDLHGVFAVDLWAKRQNMTVRTPENRGSGNGCAGRLSGCVMYGTAACTSYSAPRHRLQERNRGGNAGSRPGTLLPGKKHSAGGDSICGKHRPEEQGRRIASFLPGPRLADPVLYGGRTQFSRRYLFQLGVCTHGNRRGQHLRTGRCPDERRTTDRIQVCTGRRHLCPCRRDSML